MYMCSNSVFSFLNEKEILGTISKFTTIVTIFTKGRITSHFLALFFFFFTFSEERKTQIQVIFNTFQYYIISWNKATILFFSCSSFLMVMVMKILETWKMTKRLERFTFPASPVSSITVCETLVNIWNRMKFYFIFMKKDTAMLKSFQW